MHPHGQLCPENDRVLSAVTEGKRETDINDRVVQNWRENISISYIRSIYKQALFKFKETSLINHSIKQESKFLIFISLTLKLYYDLSTEET